MSHRSILTDLYRGGVWFVTIVFAGYVLVISQSNPLHLALWLRTDLLAIGGTLLIPLLIVSAIQFDESHPFRSLYWGMLIVTALMGFGIAQFQNLFTPSLLVYGPQASQVFPAPDVRKTPAPAHLSDEETIKAIVAAELDAIAGRNLLALESLYAPNAQVINRGHSPSDLADDIIHRGWPAIRQMHYMSLITQTNYRTPIILSDVSIHVDGDRAEAVHSGIIRNGVYFPDVSIYSFERINGQWKIVQLEFGNK